MSENVFKCSYENCNWSFSNQYKLKRHSLVHTGIKDFQCETCGKKFARQFNLTAHERTHKKEFQCMQCQKLFKSQKDLNSHNTNYHTFPRKCSQKRCLQTFDSEEALQEHLLNHSKQYVCGVCSKRFSKPFLLKQHEFVHGKEKPYKCDFENCEKSFGTQQKLKRHRLIHENKRSFTCEYANCGKSFNILEYLIAHKRTHEGYKPFKCSLDNCYKEFTCASTLKVHLQKHSNIRPYKCTFTSCDKSYLTHSNLRAHLKTHNDMTDDIGNNTAPTLAYDVDLNEFIKSPLCIPSDLNILSNQILSKEELLAATFGEFICEQYISDKPSSCAPSSNNVNVLSECEKEKMKDLQDEFVRNIYASSVHTDHSFLPSNYKANNRSHLPKMSKNYGETPHSTLQQETSVFSIYHSSKSPKETSHNLIDVPEISMSKTPDTDYKLSESSTDLQHSKCIETVTIEPCMELSTGHLEIDSGSFKVHSCVPDHVYSNQGYENNSTVNLEDIR